MNKQTIRDGEKFNWAFLIALAFTIIFLSVFPFYRGLFNGINYSFEGAIYSAVFWSAIALTAMSVYLYTYFKLASLRDLAGLIVWFVPLTYLISAFGAASSHNAGNEVYIKLLWVAFFLIGAYVAEKSWGNKTIQYTLVLSGYMLVFYGFMNWFGNAKFRDAILSNRLSNVFQYPNAYAAYLIAILLGTLVMLNGASYKRWYMRFLYSMALVPILLSFFLTLSRGAAFILPIVVLIYLFFLPWYKQIIVLIQLAISAITSIMLFSPMMDVRRELEQQFVLSASAKGWGLLLAGALFVGYLLELIRKFLLTKFHFDEQRRLSLANLIIPASFIVAAILGALVVLNSSFVYEKLPEEVQFRIDGLNNLDATSLRSAYYKDSVDILKDYPFLGAGGGAWAILYHSYKSYPYTSAQAHNFFMQYLVEVGIVGMVVLLLLIFVSYAAFIRYALAANRDSTWDETRLLFPLVSLTLLAHSMLDFDMSFVYLSAIVFLTLGASASQGGAVIRQLQRISKPVWTKTVYAVAIAVSLVFAVGTFMADRADAKFKEAIDTTKLSTNYQEIVTPLDDAIRLNGGHPDYLTFKLSLLYQVYQQNKDDNIKSQAMQILKELDRKEPFNRNAIEYYYSFHILDQEYDQAIKLLTNELTTFRWDISIYERAMQLNADLGMQAAIQNPESAAQYFKNATAIYNRFMDQVKSLDRLSKRERYESRHFVVPPVMSFSLGKVMYMNGDFEGASHELRLAFSFDFDDPSNREMVRWYLAALAHQGRTDQVLYQYLIEADSNEEQELASLIRYGDNISK